MSIRVVDQYATFWNIEEDGDKGNYALVNISTSRKDKQSGEYKNTSWRWVRFVGNAYNDDLKNLSRMTRIKINGGLSKEEYKDADGNRAWPQNPQFVIFGWSLVENTSGEHEHVNADVPPVVEDDEGDNPFN